MTSTTDDIAAPSAQCTGEGAEPGPALAPLNESQRIDSMDVIRGFALIGILMMNIEWFNRPIAELGGADTGLAGLDHAAGFFVKLFVEGKFYKLFSLLFGMGFAVMLLRAEDAARPFFGWFSRRLGVLFLFGVLHSIFLWTGDILHDYAIGGFGLLGLLWLRRKHAFRFLRNPAWLLRIGIGMTVMPLVVTAVFGAVEGMRSDPIEAQQKFEKREAERAQEKLAENNPAAAKAASAAADQAAAAAKKPTAGQADAKLAAAKSGANPADVDKKDAKKKDTKKKDTKEKDKSFEEQRREWRAKQKERVAAERKAMTSPSYLEATRFRFEKTIDDLPGAPFFALIILMPIFMIGWWLVQTGVVRRVEDHLPMLRATVFVGLVFGLLCSMSGLMLEFHPATKDGRAPEGVAWALSWAGEVLLAAGYFATIVLLLRRAFWKRMLSFLAPLGRMALTNYLMHSLVFSTLFYGYGAGWFGQVPRFPRMGLVLAMITFQVFFSRFWLAKFNYGPMEWLWRSATYRRWQALRRHPA